MAQQQNKQTHSAPYIYNKAEEIIAVEKEYDPTDTTGLVDTDGVGKVLQNLYILADADCVIRFYDYIEGEYHTNTEKIKADIPAIWKDELIGKHKITPTGASATIEIHRGSGLP